MLKQMDLVYAKAAENSISSSSMNLSNLKYILSVESYYEWFENRAGSKNVLY